MWLDLPSFGSLPESESVAGRFDRSGPRADLEMQASHGVWMVELCLALNESTERCALQSQNYQSTHRHHGRRYRHRKRFGSPCGRFVSGRLSVSQLPARSQLLRRGFGARRGTPDYSTRGDMQLITPFPRSVALADPRSAASARVEG